MMKDLLFSKCEKTITPEELTKVQATLGVTFPDTFTAHYLTFNGGNLENAVLHIPARPPIAGFRFIPILYSKAFSNDPAFSIPGRTKEEWEKGEVPSNLIPFAFDELGEYLCIDPANEGIYYFERYNDEQPPARLFNSFSEFLAAIVTGETATPPPLLKHKFWGEIKQAALGFWAGKTFSIPKFDPDPVEIFLGEELDENGDEIEDAPTSKQLDGYEKTFAGFLQHIDLIVADIQQASFERYKKTYAPYYENKSASKKAPLHIDTPVKHFKYLQQLNYIRILKRQTLHMLIRYDLDTEHGMEIKIRNNKVVAIGGIGEI